MHAMLLAPGATLLLQSDTPGLKQPWPMSVALMVCGGVTHKQGVAAPRVCATQRKATHLSCNCFYTHTLESLTVSATAC